jgi:DNA-binding NarL/FixJ family response regulator
MRSPCEGDAGASGRCAASPAGADRPLRVLLVDDHLLVRCSLRRQLAEIPGLEVVGEATDGFEAVALARTLSPDLVLMDFLMPGLDGLEATRRIMADSPRVRVIIHSTQEGSSFQEAALAAGAARYLLKGQTAQCLAEAIREIIAIR